MMQIKDLAEICQMIQISKGTLHLTMPLRNLERLSVDFPQPEKCDRNLELHESTIKNLLQENADLQNQLQTVIQTEKAEKQPLKNIIGQMLVRHSTKSFLFENKIAPYEIKLVNDITGNLVVSLDDSDI